MAYILDTASDAALNAIQDNVTTLTVCSAEPTTFAEANATYKLGSKATPTISEPQAGDVSGRKIAISAITDGVISATGTATHWALIDADTLYAVASVSVAQDLVSTANIFTLTAFDIEYPDPS